MILSTLVISQLHFEMCAGLYGHSVFLGSVGRHDFVMFRDAAFEFQKKTEHVI